MPPKTYEDLTRENTELRSLLSEGKEIFTFLKNTLELEKAANSGFFMIHISGCQLLYFTLLLFFARFAHLNVWSSVMASPFSFYLCVSNMFLPNSFVSINEVVKSSQTIHGISHRLME